MQSDDQEKLAIERIKIEVDVAKHFSALSTGSIVLITTLLDKLPKPLAKTAILQVAILCLLISLGLSVFCLWTPWQTLERKPRVAVVLTNRVSLFFAGFAFLGGLIAMGIFAIANIHHLSK